MSKRCEDAPCCGHMGACPVEGAGSDGVWDPSWRDEVSTHEVRPCGCDTRNVCDCTGEAE